MHRCGIHNAQPLPQVWELTGGIADSVGAKRTLSWRLSKLDPLVMLWKAALQEQTLRAGCSFVSTRQVCMYFCTYMILQLVVKCRYTYANGKRSLDSSLVRAESR
jgi:hypothetical protein